jgi:hypothetical protein
MIGPVPFAARIPDPRSPPLDPLDKPSAPLSKTVEPVRRNYERAYFFSGLLNFAFSSHIIFDPR